MKILNLLERRRNHEHPSQVRATTMEQLCELYFEAEEAGEEYYVSFTKLDKLGMNPQSHYTTPIGVYTYPLDYVIEFEKLSELPFAGNREHIWVIKPTTPITYLGQYNDLDYDITKLLKFLTSTFPKTDWEEYIANPNVGTEGRRIYTTCRNISFELHKTYGKSSQVMFNYLLNNILGYSIIDDNTGIIHGNEPTQCVFLRPRSYNVVKKLTATSVIGNGGKVRSNPLRIPVYGITDKNSNGYIQLPQGGFKNEDCEVVLHTGENSRSLNLFDIYQQSELLLVTIPTDTLALLVKEKKYSERIEDNIVDITGRYAMANRVSAEAAFANAEKNRFIKAYLSAAPNNRAVMVKELQDEIDRPQDE